MKNFVTVALSACLLAAGMVLHAQDRVVAVTNAEGQVARMEYEIGDKVSRMTRFDGTEVGYTQNAYGLLSAAYPSFTNTYERLMDGSLLSATGPNGTIGYTYDKFGNVTGVATEQGGMTSTYDTAGNVTRRDFDFGSFECAYDQAGRVTGMTWNVGGLTMPFGYSYSQENGSLAAVEYPNAVTRELGYDVMDRVAEIAWSGYDTADADSREYSYDNADNIVSISTADGATIDYAYDGIDRLAGESKSNAAGETVRTAAFIYDACGNRICNSLTSDGVTEEFANSFIVGDRLAGWTRTGSYTWADSVTNTVYLYAASGCTTGIVSHVADGTVRNVNYAWTDDYRLASVSVDGAAVAEYKYDVFGNLVGVANGEESFEILVDGDHSLADVSSDGTPLRVYMRGPGVDNWLGFVDMTGAAPVPYYYVTDHLGSVLAVVDANGNVVERYEYDAWGQVLSVTDASGNGLARSAIRNRILWQGREYSWTTGLYYFRNRWYDPTIGRWISKDPIGIQGGINLYEFCEGNPLTFQDPSGLVDLNLFPPLQPISAQADGYNPSGVFSVGAHGDEKGIGWPFMAQAPQNEPRIPAKKLANRIKNHPKFHRQPVQLAACNVGNGQYPQKLADELGVEVRAPNRYACYISRGDRVTVEYYGITNRVENGRAVERINWNDRGQLLSFFPRSIQSCNQTN